MSEFFVLRTNDLAGLQRNREPNESDCRTARRTLHLLWQQGYVHRIAFLDLDQVKGGATYAYGLSDKGVREYGGKTFDEHSERTLDHELAITDFHIATKHLCVSEGLDLYWQQENLKRGIHPDAYFSVCNRNRPIEKSTSHFFLEIERQRTSAFKGGKPSIFRKAQRYYDYYNTNECAKDWGLKTFRVIFVQKNVMRRCHFLSVLQKELSHRMFWLGIEGNVAEFVTPLGDTFSFIDI
jgi:hypothetical protein